MSQLQGSKTYVTSDGSVPVTAPLSVGTAVSAGDATRFDQVIGLGQTWQTVTRVIGTVYTNATGKPIIFKRYIANSSSSWGSVICEIDGVDKGAIGVAASIDSAHTLWRGTAFMVIPAGSTYKFTSSTVTDFGSARRAKIMPHYNLNNTIYWFDTEAEAAQYQPTALHSSQTKKLTLFALMLKQKHRLSTKHH